MANQYFQHDYYARCDGKIEDLIDDYGLLGYGAFWVIVERIHEQLGSLPVKRLQNIADEYHCSIQMLEDIVDKYGLFRIDSGDKIVSDRIKANFKARKEASEKMRKIVNERWERQKNTKP